MDAGYIIFGEHRGKGKYGGTSQIIQTVRAALAFWVKEYIGYKEIEKREQWFINKALERLLPNPNIEILGNLSIRRQAILSFLIYTTTNEGNDIVKEKEGGLNMWAETGNKRDKPLNGAFVATLLNDLFGIQSRGGCACAGPYGHLLLNINKCHSLAIRSAIKEVKEFLTLTNFFSLHNANSFFFVNNSFC